MQAITPDLAAILKDKFQAGASGFRARIEVDSIIPITPTLDPCEGGTYSPTQSKYYPPLGSRVTDADALFYYYKYGLISPTVPTPGYLGNWNFPKYRSAGSTYNPAGWHDHSFGTLGNQVYIVVVGSGTLTLYTYDYAANGAGLTLRLPPSDGSTLVASGTSGTPMSYHVEAGVDCVSVFVMSADAVTGFDGGDWLSDYYVGEDPVTDYQVVPLSYRCKRVSIDKSLRMTADQATVEIPNDTPWLGWGPSSVFKTNSRLRVFEWYGDAANEVLAFTGIIDTVVDSRDVLTTQLACRDMMALLIDQTFGATAPQGADEDGAVRTIANGVYLSMEISDIVEDILDRAGWPTADRDITATSYVLDEYIIPDGTSWAEAIIGEAVLTGLVGFNAWADEAGVFHFAPSTTTLSLTDPQTPAYTYASGVDIVSLQEGTDQYDLRTRVKVRGPLTTQTLTDVWREVWRTGKFAHPVGLWYDPAETTVLRVLDRGTKRLYRLRLADRVVLSSTYLGTVIPYPLGVSGDPSDATIYWVLNGPWLWGSGANSSIKKVRKADNVVLATYTLDTDHWSAIKVSGAYIYVTNLSDEHVYRRDKTDGSAVDDFRHTYSGTAQSNPSGIMIDGTTISVFWSNGGTTARFLQCAEAAPGTVTKVVKTAGTSLHGGEMNTTDHVTCWGDDDGSGITAEFTLVDVADVTNEVYAEVVDTALEDELGALAQMESREHDTHTGDADHAYEIRRDTVDVTVVTSLAQATETAMRRLDLLSQRRRVLDVGIIGNPALQKTDVVRVVDPITSTASDWMIDTYRSEMAADSTYLGTLALLPVTVPDDDPTDDGDATE